MKFKRISTLEAWESLSDEWNALVVKGATNVPFLRYEYLRTWWDTRGGGEWNAEESKLFIVCAERDGELVGIAPLFSTRNHDNEPVLMLIGSIEVSDYLDLIACEEDLPEFVSGLFDFLNEQQESEARHLDLYNLQDDSPSLKLLGEIGAAKGWQTTTTKLQPSPYISLPAEWESYLAGLDKKQRHEIRRKMRRASEAPLAVEWTVVDDKEKVATEAEAFIEMMAGDPAKKAFLTEAMREYLREIAAVTLEHKWLQLSFLTIDGEKAAAYFCFVYANKVWVYNSAWNIRYGDYSPGWVLLGHIIQWAIENGIEELDFMRGDEAYKYKFGGVERFVMRCELRKG
ncbi:MAG: GNAT family N-acetyltransferase [Anaerolineaceae bacterium]|nr:GNAT family N-acetyltransferase [Anaerolineaceae bacterium]